MTQTTYEVKVLTAVHQRYGNKALSELVFENIKAVGRPEYTQEEEAYARALQKNAGFPVRGLDYPLELTGPESEPYKAGSSDCGDVSLLAPYAQLRFPAQVPGSPAHHWTVASTSLTSTAHKGITAGAKAASFTAYDLLTKPELMVPIRKEFEVLSRERPYKTFLPEGAEPPLGWNTGLMERYRADMEKFHITP